MPSLSRLGDDHFITRFNVDVKEPTGKDVVGDDGRPVSDWMHGGDLTQTTTYNGTLERLDGRWSLLLTWVDFENGGHRVVLPDAVVQRFVDSHNRLTKQMKSTRAKKAFKTRLEKGNVAEPFLTEAQRERSANVTAPDD